MIIGVGTWEVTRGGRGGRGWAIVTSIFLSKGDARAPIPSEPEQDLGTGGGGDLGTGQSPSLLLFILAGTHLARGRRTGEGKGKRGRLGSDISQNLGPAAHRTGQPRAAWSSQQRRLGTWAPNGVGWKTRGAGGKGQQLGYSSDSGLMCGGSVGMKASEDRTSIHVV